MVVANLHCFQIFQERRTFIPRSSLAAADDVVAFKRGEGDAPHVGDVKRLDKGGEVLDDAVENVLAVVLKVHFVHGKHDVANAEEGAEIGVTLGLSDDAGACIHEDDGEIGGGAAGNHVSRVLLVSRSVGNDELAFVGGEVAIGNVNGDALFALRLQSVAEEGIVNLSRTGISDTAGITLEGRKLVFIEFFRVEKETTDEG